MNLIKDVIGAMFRLPMWVVIWANILFTVNMASFVWIFFDPHPIVIAAVIANVVALFPNFYLLYRLRGLGKFMGISHIVGWVPLCAYIYLWLFTDSVGGPLTSADGSLYYFAWTLFVVNLISLAFDIADFRLVLKGDRTVIRTAEGEARYRELTAP
jgi:hypothetical protein